MCSISVAEDLILKYLKECNRPYGSSDISANLKNAVPKTAAQKILMTLAAKGEITQKTYGKMTFFVANQSDLEDMPPEKINALTEELNVLQERVKETTTLNKTLQNELAKLRSTPTSSGLDTSLAEAQSAIKLNLEALEPLRNGQPVLSEEDAAKLDSDWIKWRTEWKARKKLFNSAWASISESLSSGDAADLIENLGIELDGEEHLALEKSTLCTNPAASAGLKRKRGV
ncbi:hypothetical protein BOTBODRAFT_109484 [Botryobasidium botryosum FD-172 SS1]|uniref:Homologous-pairing protein 2 winged helix domain-containing protein n=1 Tax=Botryobasidium botryosum (strain FD-172 SS1) TaxID=930990 RepID=A0A067MH93_BOTB1|nr:hypothetical protein BOTBODRAFT_109484 [Botryobasidium botryosum FD-172 SS1]